MTVPVLYRNNDLIICEKPAGVPSESPGLPDIVASQTGCHVYSVHRLDKNTGGVIILAFSAGSCSAIQNMFHRGLVQKEYLAVVSGKPVEPAGRYEDLLFHDRVKNKTYIVTRERAGVKKGICEWRLLSSVMFSDQMLSLIKVPLHTGRTHQIRVQFGSRGLPLIGDRKYGSRVSAEAPALWASGISFPQLRSGSSCPLISACSAPPPSFPWALFDIAL